MDGLGASTSSMWTRTTIENARLAVEIFDGTGHFDETFKDEDLALMLLRSLPEEFEFLETTLLHGRSDISLSEVCAALYNYEQRKKDKQKNSIRDTEALVIRGRSYTWKKTQNGRSNSKSRLRKDECGFCHEKGHWKKNCPKLKNKGKAAVDACVAKHDTSDFELSLVASSSSFHSDEWILDSGYTYHMSPNREWFSDLVELNGGVVYIGNDNTCKTIGIGSIQLKNQDGSTRVLTDVRCYYERWGFESDIWRTCDIERHQKNNLYYYQGSTVIGAVAAASGNKELDSMQLWHMKLGQASGKSLQILAKQGLLKGAKACKLKFCKHCVLGKQKRVKFGTAIHNTKGILEYVHSDV
ncbi:hypothetical protein PVK06_041907 [Gossypium arboreum]|uniref:Retrovirus-related Pol polyprotein from transposon TNT 1-94 n=1 Tax=Gossypium arboreum TaxID=29729 RepID=A0ABR0N9J6_GOSAR|nr:hypothetical protein PVK06_041907 [Gossypium arboreum]